MSEQLVRTFFQGLTPERRINLKKHYEELLAINAGTYTPRFYPITHKLAGKRMQMHKPMPWMEKSWRNGLRILNEVINEKEAK